MNPQLYIHFDEKINVFVYTIHQWSKMLLYVLTKQPTHQGMDFMAMFTLHAFMDSSDFLPVSGLCRLSAYTNTITDLYSIHSFIFIACQKNNRWHDLHALLSLDGTTVMHEADNSSNINQSACFARHVSVSPTINY